MQLYRLLREREDELDELDDRGLSDDPVSNCWHFTVGWVDERLRIVIRGESSLDELLRDFAGQRSVAMRFADHGQYNSANCPPSSGLAREVHRFDRAGLGAEWLEDVRCRFPDVAIALRADANESLSEFTTDGSVEPHRMGASALSAVDADRTESDSALDSLDVPVLNAAESVAGSSHADPGGDNTKSIPKTAAENGPKCEPVPKPEDKSHGAASASQLDNIPLLDKTSGEWVTAKQAVEIDGVKVASLNTMRRQGVRSPKHDMGIDPSGRMWRKDPDLPHGPPLYFKSSLKSFSRRE